MTPKPAVSVVIVTWNRRKELEVLLRSLFAQTIADRLEVIVIDNKSEDDTLEWLRTTPPGPVRLFAYDKNMGASIARNAGILMASAPYILFVDSDAVVLSPDAVERCLARLEESPDTDATAAPIWLNREHNYPFMFGGYVSPEGHYHGPHCRWRSDEPMLFSTCFALWRRETLITMRGFDPWYFWGIEDMDLGLRTYFARKRQNPARVPFILVQGIDVLHEKSDSGRHYEWRSFDLTFRRYERQRLYMVLAYGGFWHCLRVIARAPFRLARTEEAWEHKLTPSQKFLTFVVAPMRHLLFLPMSMISIRRNHLARTPMPRDASRPSAA